MRYHRHMTNSAPTAKITLEESLTLIDLVNRHSVASEHYTTTCRNYGGLSREATMAYATFAEARKALADYIATLAGYAPTA